MNNRNKALVSTCTAGPSPVVEVVYVRDSDKLERD